MFIEKIHKIPFVRESKLFKDFLEIDINLN